MTESSRKPAKAASLNKGITPAPSSAALDDRLQSVTAEAQAAMVRLGRLLSVSEAAKLLGVKIWPVYRAVKDGHLPAFQPGGEGSRILIRPTDLERYVLASATR